MDLTPETILRTLHEPLTQCIGALRGIPAVVRGTQVSLGFTEKKEWSHSYPLQSPYGWSAKK